MMDGRRRRWFSLSALYPHGETARRIQGKFGRDGLLVWILFLAACKRSPIQEGSFSYTSEDAAWTELGLVDPEDRPAFSLDEFWKFTGRLKQTRRTRSGHVVNVTATHWKEWQDASKRSLEAERKSRKRGEKTADVSGLDSDSDSDPDRDQDRDKNLRAAGGEPAASIEREISSALGAPRGALENLGSDRIRAFESLIDRVAGGDPGTPRVLETMCKRLPADRIDAVVAKFHRRRVPAGVVVNELKKARKEYEAEIEAEVAA